MFRVLWYAMVMLFFVSLGMGESYDPANLQKNFRIMLRTGSDYIVGGDLIDLNKFVTPQPDYLNLGVYGAELDMFFFENFGVLAGYDFCPIIAQKSGYKPLIMAYTSKIFAGLAYLIPVFSNSRMLMDIKLAGGANYNFFDWSPDFKALGSGVTWYQGQAVGLGYFAGGSFEFIYNIFIVGLGVYYEYYNYKYADAAKPFDMMAVEIPLTLGLAF